MWSEELNNFLSLICDIRISLVEEQIIVAAVLNFHLLFFLLLVLLSLVLVLRSAVVLLPLLLIQIKGVIKKISAHFCDPARLVRKRQGIAWHNLPMLFYRFVIIIVFITILSLNITKELFNRVGAFITIVEIASI